MILFSRTQDQKKFALLKTILKARKTTAADTASYQFISEQLEYAVESCTTAVPNLIQPVEVSGFKRHTGALLESNLILKFSLERQ